MAGVKRNHLRKTAIVIICVFAVFVAGVATAWLAGFRINVTPSFPEGLWRLESGHAKKGMLVLFCPPNTSIFRMAKHRDYIPFGMCPGWYTPMIKRIVAVSGDHVRVSMAGVFVNGVRLKNSSVLKKDSSGRPLPCAASGIVPQGSVWLMSDYNPRSFDSRYFGPIPVRQIEGPAKLELPW